MAHIHVRDVEVTETALAPKFLDATIHVGDALDTLAAMPDGSAHCIVTSPPYWVKRDYGMTGQYRLEDDPAAYIATLLEVFREAGPAHTQPDGRPDHQHY